MGHRSICRMSKVQRILSRFSLGCVFTPWLCVAVVGLSDGRFTLTALAPGLAQNLGPMAHIRTRKAAALLACTDL